jgi:hypothetical protein
MIEYRFRVPSAAVFTLYSYSKALEYPLRVVFYGGASSAGVGVTTADDTPSYPI